MRLAKPATAIFFLTLIWLWCQKFFSFSTLNSHVMLDGDPALNAWALDWVTRALASDWSNLLNGNTFYPHPGAITLSEHMTGLALFNLPIRLFTGGPWIGYNISILFAYLLSALGGYLLIKELTHSRLAGVWGGIFWAFCFFRTHHIGHIQILAYQWFPFIALYLLRTLNRPTYLNALLLAVFFIFQAFTSWYLAVIAAFLVITIFLCNIRHNHWDKKHLSALLLSATLVLIAILPFALSYLNAFRVSSLSDRLSAIHSSGDQVSLLDFFFPPVSTYFGSLIPNNKYWIWGENTLYIGYTACILALLGLWYGWRQNKRLTITGFVLIVLGFILALGYTSPRMGVKLPLYYLSQLFPLFSAIRATQRYALLIYFGVLLLSGYGMAFLLKNRQHYARYLIAFGLSVLFLIEVYPYKLPFGQPLPYTPSALDREILKMYSTSSKPPVILHYPIYTALPGYPTGDATYMADSTLHWGNILNGFSGAEPLGFKKDMMILNQIPDPSSLHLLKKYGVTVLAIHRGLDSKHKESIRSYFQTTGQGEIHQVNQDEFLIILKTVSNENLNTLPSRP